jgi:hypothetical protein
VDLDTVALRRRTPSPCPTWGGRPLRSLGNRNKPGIRRPGAALSGRAVNQFGWADRLMQQCRRAAAQRLSRHRAVQKQPDRSRPRPMRGLKRLRSAEVISAGHAFFTPPPRPLRTWHRRRSAAPNPARLHRTRRRYLSPAPQRPTLLTRDNATAPSWALRTCNPRREAPGLRWCAKLLAWIVCSAAFLPALQPPASCTRMIDCNLHPVNPGHLLIIPKRP